MRYWSIIIHVFLSILAPIFLAIEAAATVEKEVILDRSIKVSPTDRSTQRKVSDSNACFAPLFSSSNGFVEDQLVKKGNYQIDAFRIEGELSDRMKFSGGVKVKDGERLIFAPTLQWERVTGLVDFSQGLELTSPNFLMRGEAASLDLNNTTLRVTQPKLRFSESDIRLYADSMEQNRDGDMSLSGLTISSCGVSAESWSLTAKRMTLVEESKNGLARNLILRLKGVPVFYAPWLPIPMGGGSENGFSFPSLGLSSEDGLQVGLPYQFNWSEKDSLILTPNLISKRGPGFKLDGSFVGDWHQTEFAGGYVHRDRLFNGTLTREEYYRFDREINQDGFDGVDRWNGRIKHLGRIGFFETEINHNFMSDLDYFRDVSSSYSGIEREALPQFARLGIVHRNLSVDIFVKDYEIADPISSPGYRVQPEFSIGYKFDLPRDVDVDLSYRSTNFTGARDALKRDGIARAKRDHLEALVFAPFRSRLGWANLEAGYRYTDYSFRETDKILAQKKVEAQSRGIGFLSLDARTIFEKEVTWGDRGFIHSLQPRAYYLSQQYKDQSSLPLFDTLKFFDGYSQLFRRDRFSGIDRISDANELTVGFTSSLVNRQNGRESAIFRFGKTFEFRDRKVSLDDLGIQQNRDKKLLGDLSLTLSDRLRATVGFVWDDTIDDWTQSSLHLNYSDERGKLFNLGFSKIFDYDIKQTDISMVLPVKESMSVFGRWNYDWSGSRTVDSFFGLQYEDCCLEVKLGYRKTLDIPASSYYPLAQTEESVLLQVNFKGFTDFGSRVDSIIRQGIRGYAERK